MPATVLKFPTTDRHVEDWLRLRGEFGMKVRRKHVRSGRADSFVLGF